MRAERKAAEDARLAENERQEAARQRLLKAFREANWNPQQVAAALSKQQEPPNLQPVIEGSRG